VLADSHAVHWTVMSSLSRRLKTSVIAPLSAVFLQALSLSAHADVQVSGEGNAIRLEASDASLEEVLAALSTHCDLQFRYPEKLGRSVSGTFTGSLAQLLTRLLQGYNFVAETSASGTRVVVYDLNAAHETGINIVHNGPSELHANPARSAPALRPGHGHSSSPPVRDMDRTRSARVRRPPISQ
jgi:hypothetical protein